MRYTQTMGFIDHCDIVDDYTINLVTASGAKFWAMNEARHRG